MQFDQRFRRGADDLQVAKVEIEHVRRWIEQSKCPIRFERRHVGLAAKQYRQHDLVDITRRDIFLAGLNSLGELLLAQARLGLLHRHTVA